MIVCVCVCVQMGGVLMKVTGINSGPRMASVRTIHLIQKVCDQMEHLINPHSPDSLCQPRADRQYCADVKRLGEPGGKDSAKKEESDECSDRSYLAHKAGSLLAEPDGRITLGFKFHSGIFR